MENAFTDWEYLFVEAMFVLDPQNPQGLSDRVMFFDHYAREYGGQRSDLDTYFAKLTADGWERAGGPESYNPPDRKAADAVRLRQPPSPMMQHLSWLFDAPGRKLYRFKRPLKR
jgi:hypothetical protein